MYMFQGFCAKDSSPMFEPFSGWRGRLLPADRPAQVLSGPKHTRCAAAQRETMETMGMGWKSEVSYISYMFHTILVEKFKTWTRHLSGLRMFKVCKSRFR